MVITKTWFSHRKSRSVNIFFQQPDFGNLGQAVNLEASRPTYWGVWGAEPPRKKGSYILHVSVDGSVHLTSRQPPKSTRTTARDDPCNQLRAESCFNLLPVFLEMVAVDHPLCESSCNKPWIQYC